MSRWRIIVMRATWWRIRKRWWRFRHRVRRGRPVPWTVIPALPGTAIEWTADWCTDGWVRVHAWLIPLDIEPLTWDVGDGAKPEARHIDTSCACGYPMVLAADGQLQDARYADIDGTAGAVFEQ